MERRRATSDHNEIHPISLSTIADDTWNHWIAPVAVQVIVYGITLSRFREIINAKDR